MVILEDDNILRCTWLSIARAITDAAVLGLAIGKGVTANCYILPFENRKESTFEAVLVIGYKGMLDLAERSGKLSSCSYNVVREGDEFSYSLGIEVECVHRPSTDPARASRPITHAYCAGKKTNGGKFAVVMTAAEIIAHRDRYAKGFTRDDSPWRTAEEAMFAKTAVRHAFNRRYLPMSAEDFRLVEASIRREDVIEGTYTVIDHDILPPLDPSLDHSAASSTKTPDTPQITSEQEEAEDEDFARELRETLKSEGNVA